ncbi:MAG: hypothetical protein NY202_03535 [Mollicutes bacterium UO1]
MDNYRWEVMGDKAKLSLIIHAITHEKTSFYDCPYTETCEGCNKKLLTGKMELGIGEDDRRKYYCRPCFNKKYGEYLKERAKKKEITPEQKEVMRVVQKAVNEHLESN